MPRFLSTRLVVASATVALTIAVGGAALAAGTSGATIAACVHHYGGGLYRARRCSRGDPRLTWNVQGQQGVPGPQGPAGSDGLPATKLWAVVDGSAPSIVRGSGATGVSVPASTGTYEVDFNRDVSQCAYSATLGQPTAGLLGPAVGFVGVEPSYGVPNGVFVQTNDRTGTAANESFYLTVFC